MSEHYDGLLRQSVSDEWVPISKQISRLNLEARISQIINYLQHFPILTGKQNTLDSKHNRQLGNFANN